MYTDIAKQYRFNSSATWTSPHKGSSLFILTQPENSYWLGVRRWFLPGALVSSTCYNRLVATRQYGRKSDKNQYSKFQSGWATHSSRNAGCQPWETLVGEVRGGGWGKEYHEALAHERFSTRWQKKWPKSIFQITTRLWDSLRWLPALGDSCRRRKRRRRISWGSSPQEIQLNMVEKVTKITIPNSNQSEILVALAALAAGPGRARRRSKRRTRRRRISRGSSPQEIQLNMAEKVTKINIPNSNQSEILVALAALAAGPGRARRRSKRRRRRISWGSSPREI